MSDEQLPEYAAVVAECGDPDSTVEELNAQLDADTTPEIVTWCRVQQDEPDKEE